MTFDEMASRLAALEETVARNKQEQPDTVRHRRDIDDLQLMSKKRILTAAADAGAITQTHTVTIIVNGAQYKISAEKVV